MTRDELKAKLNQYVDQIPALELDRYIWDDCLRVQTERRREHTWEHRARTFDTREEPMAEWIEKMFDDGWHLFTDIVAGPLVTLVFSREKHG
jgi:hypothetical protein